MWTTPPSRAPGPAPAPADATTVQAQGGMGAAEERPDYTLRAPTSLGELNSLAEQLVEEFPGPADIATMATWWWDGTLGGPTAQLLEATSNGDEAATALLLAASLMANCADAHSEEIANAWAAVEAQVVGRGRPWPADPVGHPADTAAMDRRECLLEFICQRNRAAKVAVSSLARAGVSGRQMAWWLTELILHIDEARFTPLVQHVPRLATEGQRAELARAAQVLLRLTKAASSAQAGKIGRAHV